MTTCVSACVQSVPVTSVSPVKRSSLTARMKARVDDAIRKASNTSVYDSTTRQKANRRQRPTKVSSWLDVSDWLSILLYWLCNGVSEPFAMFVRTIHLLCVILTSASAADWGDGMSVMLRHGSRAMDGCIPCRGTTSSCQSAATSKFVKRCCSRVFSCRQRYIKYPGF